MNKFIVTQIIEIYTDKMNMKEIEDYVIEIKSDNEEYLLKDCRIQDVDIEYSIDNVEEIEVEG